MTEPEPEGIYVPVVNTNYIPEGVEHLQGYVPYSTPDDKLLVGIKENLEGMGLESGPIADTDPTPPDPEAPIDQEDEPEEAPTKSNVYEATAPKA